MVKMKTKLQINKIVLLDGLKLADHRENCSGCLFCLNYEDNNTYSIKEEKMLNKMFDPRPEQYLSKDKKPPLTEDIYLYLKMKECNDVNIGEFFGIGETRLAKWKADRFSDYKNGELMCSFEKNSEDYISAFIVYRLKKFLKNNGELLTSQ